MKRGKRNGVDINALLYQQHKKLRSSRLKHFAFLHMHKHTLYAIHMRIQLLHTCNSEYLGLLCS